MKLEELENIDEIYENEEIANILSEVIFAPSYGKLKSISEGIYRKKHAKFYILKRDTQVIAVVGVMFRDIKNIEIKHIAVAKDENKNVVKAQLIDLLKEKLNVSSFRIEIERESIGFYKKNGFKCEAMDDKGYGIQSFLCIKNYK